jgi:hypothetical protein
MAGGVGQEHRDLGVLDAPGGAGVVALHTDTVRSLLEVTGVVEDQHRPGVTQLVDHIAAHIIADGVGVPHRLTQQPLHPMRCAVSGPLGQLPTGVSVQIRQQPEQEQPCLAAGLHPPEPARDPGEPRVELGQPTLGVYAVASGRHGV